LMLGGSRQTKRLKPHDCVDPEPGSSLRLRHPWVGFDVTVMADMNSVARRTGPPQASPEETLSCRYTVSMPGSPPGSSEAALHPFQWVDNAGGRLATWSFKLDCLRYQPLQGR